MPTDPTAKQLVGLAHDTWSRALSTEVTGFGPAAIDQLVPSHCSMRSVPTAKQLVGLAHDTLTSELAYCEGRFGLATTVQLVPSQCSVKVCDPKDPDGTYEPTAKQLVTLEHAMPASELCVHARRYGAGTDVPARPVPLLDEGAAIPAQVTAREAERRASRTTRFPPPLRAARPGWDSPRLTAMWLPQPAIQTTRPRCMRSLPRQLPWSNGADAPACDAQGPPSVIGTKSTRSPSEAQCSTRGGPELAGGPARST